MGAGIRIELEGVRAKLSPQAVTNGRRALANEALADMHPFVTMKEGILRQTGSIALDGSTVIYDTPYAKSQFYGKSKRASWNKGKQPGTGPRWDLKAKGLYMPKWERAFLRGAGF